MPVNAYVLIQTEVGRRPPWPAPWPPWRVWSPPKGSPAPTT